MFPPSEFNSDIFSEFVDSYLEIQRRVQKFFNQLTPNVSQTIWETDPVNKICPYFPSYLRLHSHIFHYILSQFHERKTSKFSRCSNSLMFPYKEYIRTTSLVLLVDGPWGLLDFVLRALWALRPCDPRNDVSDSEKSK